MGRSIGIDLGTTFSAMAAVNESGKPEIILNREGDRITPSVVLLQGEVPVVGSIARRSASSFASNVVQFVKRNMGNPHWEFVTEGGQSFRPEEVSALILKRMKEDAELALRAPVDKAVISVPAYFDDGQRRATIDAGRIAGLDVLRVINEPTAAALAYGIDATSTATVMVYDLGGGTFDVTVMRVGDGELEVLATGGDRNLGGFDWDNALMGWLNQRFMQREGPDLLTHPALEQDLRDKAEIAKRTLTTRNEAVVLLTAEGVTEYVCVMREDFEELTAPLLQRTETIMNMVLDDAKLTWPDVDQVLLVGGSTRMPAVLRLVEQVSGREPELGVNPDEIVALGAALQAALLSADDLPPSLENVTVQDVNSHSMGVAAHAEDGRMANTVVLPRGAQVPCTGRRTYCTVAENQTVIELQVTEGEDCDLAYVKIVGETRIEIPAYPRGAPVEVVFSYDADGIIHVSVVDLTANTELGELVIDRRSNLTELEVAEKSSRIAVLDVA